MPLLDFQMFEATSFVYILYVSADRRVRKQGGFILVSLFFSDWALIRSASEFHWESHGTDKRILDDDGSMTTNIIARHSGPVKSATGK